MDRDSFFGWLRLPRILLAVVVMVAAGSPVLADELAYTFGGNANWSIQSATTHDSVDAYQSGAISSNQSSWMETTVTGPGAVRFWWKVSSEPCCDSLAIAIDGISQTNIRGEVDWQAKAFSIPAGSHTLRWTYATDGSVLSGSNAGWVDQVSFEAGNNIDATPPTTSATPAGGLYGTPQSVTLSCNDSSGCTGTFYCLGSGCTPTTPYTGPINVSTPTDLRFYSTDTAGNYELVKTATYAFDTTPPNTSVSLSAGTYEGQRSVSLYCYDSASYCATTYYCLGNGCTPATAYSSPVTVSASTDLRYYSTDRFANSEAVKTATYTITPDATPPTTTTSYPSGTYSNPSVYLFCSDGSGSGCAATYYCLGAGCTPTTRFPGSLSITSSTDLRFYSQDSSGNSEAIKTVSYTIDNTPPTTSVTPAGGIFPSSQSLTLACSDDSGSGCSTTYYCLGKECSPNTPYTGPVSVTSSTYLTYYSRDTVRNQESSKTERYTILTAPPATINVPTDQTTIQAAIDAANDGDTVVVAPGTYVENINFKGKAITVTSSGGADVTTIDGNQAGTVVTFGTGEWRTSELSGFTIRNGNANSAFPTYGRGGGIYINIASPTIVDNKIIQNHGVDGAGIYAGGSPIIRGNLISGNSRTAGWSGGFGGGGIYLCGGSAQIVDNTISNNTMTEAHGGGIYLTCDGQNIIRGNVISHNGGAGLRGGGIYVDGFSIDHQIVQNLIADNSASYGGGIYLPRGILVANNTIAENSAFEGSGIYLDRYAWGGGLIINNVLVGKAGQSTIYSESRGELNPPLKNNILFSPTNNVNGGTFTSQNGINGNIIADPQLSGPAFGYYSLRPGSPAIDAGDNVVSSLPTTDFKGIPRLVDGNNDGTTTVDIGAYEFDPSEPRVVLSGAPAAATQETAATVTVGGTGIVSYRYALDGGTFTTDDTPVSTPISLTGLTGGIHAVAVIGKTSDREQSISSATIAEWTVDTISPTTTATPAGGSYATVQSVTLTCADGTGSGCSGTFYCLGGNCTPTTPYAGPITVASTSALRFYSQDAFGNREEVKSASFNFVGTISGRVTESAAGAGVQGVNVSAYNAATGAFVAYGYTDSAGAYQIPQLASGNYKLRFSGYDYVEQWYSAKADRAAATIVAISAPGVTNGIDVVMVKGGSISGTVTGKDTGTGLQWAYVAAYNAATGSLTGSGPTDAAGAYRISGLAPGDYKLRFNRPSSSGYLDQWYSDKSDISSANPVSVTSYNITSGIDVSLQAGGSITGTVMDSASGTAIPEVFVTAVDAVTGSWIGSTSTDSSGAYRIVGLAGSYKLKFSGSGYVEQWYGGASSQAAATTVTVTAQNAIAGINVALVKGARITGTVTDSVTGAAIQGVSVAALNPVTGSLAGRGYTDSTGGYGIAGLATGSYKIRFSTAGYMEQWSGAKADQSTAVPVAVTAPDTTADVNAALVKGGSISGTVTDKGTGVAIHGISVSAYNTATGSFVGYGYTDGSGGYSISGLTSGRYKLQFSDNSSAGYPTQWFSNKELQGTADIVEVTAPNSVTGIDLAMEMGGAIAGVVTDSATGAPLQNVSVGAYTLTGQWVRSGYTDSSGTYSIAGVATGSYKIEFSRTGYVKQWSGGKADRTAATAVAVTAPDTTEGVDMALARGGSIAGTVADRITGVGIVGAYLYAIDRSTGDWAGSASTDSNGAYEITGLASGSYRLRIGPAYGTGYLGGWYGGQEGYLCSGTVSVTAPEATSGIDALLDMGGSISGMVTDAATGSGIAGVGISPASNSTVTGTNSSNMTIDASGAYTIGGLSSGEYSLTFSAPGYVRTTGSTVTVTAPDALSGVNVSLARGGGISGRVTDSVTGEGVEGVLVVAQDVVTRAWVANGTSDYQGDYAITGLPSGSYTITYDARYAGSGYGSSTTGGVITSTSTSTSSGFSVSASSVDAGAITPVTSSVTAAKSLASPVLSVAGTHVVHPSVSACTALPTSTSTSTTIPASVPASDPVSVVAPAMTTGIDIRIDRLGAIAGRVTDSAGDEPLNWISVAAYDGITGAWAGSAVTNSDGTYTISGVPSGSYRLQFTGIQSADGGYLSKWYGSGTDSTVTAEVAVQAPETTSGIDARLARGGGIAGSISVNVCPGPQQVAVMAYDAAGGKLVGQTWVDTNNVGRFTIGALPAGSYKLAIAPGEAGFVRQWYPNKTEAASAEPVTVTAGAITADLDVTLAAGGGSISGKVTGNTGCAYLFSPVTLYDWYSGGLVAETSTSYDGSYQLPGLPDGTYKLLFFVDRVDRWYRTSAETSQASPVVVSGAATVTGIDLTVASGPDGDLDASGGQPGLLDAIKALRVAVGLEVATPEILAHGDLAPVVDGVSMPDGRIDVADALLVLRKVISSAVVTVSP